LLLHEFADQQLEVSSEFRLRGAANLLTNMQRNRQRTDNEIVDAKIKAYVITTEWLSPLSMTQTPFIANPHPHDFILLLHLNKPMNQIYLASNIPLVPH
jgi:hypothetical protein